MDNNEKRIFKIVNEKRMSEDDRYILKEAIRGWIKSIDPLFVEEVLRRTSYSGDIDKYRQQVDGLLNLGVGLPFNHPEYQAIIWMIENGNCKNIEPESEYTLEEYMRVATEAYEFFNKYQEDKKQKSNGQTLYYILG